MDKRDFIFDAIYSMMLETIQAAPHPIWLGRTCDDEFARITAPPNPPTPLTSLPFPTKRA